MALLDNLLAIGFTEYEAKVYLALLRQHPATGYQLSKASGVPRSMVYEALSRLHNRGAALETVEGRSTLYRPLPPQLLLEQHETEHKRLLGELRSGLETLYTASADERAWTIRDRAAIVTYAARLIDESTAELYLVLADADLAGLGASITAAAGRGVAVNALLTGAGTLAHGHIARHPPLESEVQGLTETLVVVADNREALIASARPAGGRAATVTGSADLVLIARQFVWMELFTHRIYARLSPEALAQLEPADRRLFDSLAQDAGGALP
jgi:Cd2+/Zn2+-exporting ATPase